MKTLFDYLTTGSIPYDLNWAIYAETVNGEFKPESPARYGESTSQQWEGEDGYEMFGEVNRRWCEIRREQDDLKPEEIEEWAMQLIQTVNEELKEWKAKGA